MSTWAELYRGKQIPLKICSHVNMRWDNKYDFHCPDCDEKYEVMANGDHRQICHVCGGRHWR